MIRLLERGSWTLDDWKLVVCNADDAEVVPPALRARSDWLYARMDGSQGHHNVINPLARLKYGRRGGRPSRAMRTTRRSSLPRFSRSDRAALEC